MRDFCPISLIRSLYKIQNKVLPNHLPKVLSQVISETQSAFVDGRQILDSAIASHECLIQDFGGICLVLCVQT